jgi:hypothetical protein
MRIRPDFYRLFYGTGSAVSVTDAAIPWESEPKWTVDLLAERTLLPRGRIVDAAARGELPVTDNRDEPRFYMRDVFLWVTRAPGGAVGRRVA